MSVSAPVSRLSVPVSAGVSVPLSAARVTDTWRVLSLTADSTLTAVPGAGAGDVAGGTLVSPAGGTRRPGILPGPGRRPCFTGGGYPVAAPGTDERPAGLWLGSGRPLPHPPVPVPSAAPRTGRARRARAARGNRPGSAADGFRLAASRRRHPRNHVPVHAHAQPGACASTHARACEEVPWRA